MPTLSGMLQWLSRELGLRSMAAAGRDAHILLILRFFRMFAFGSVALILALHFAALGHSDERIGLFMTLTLLGDVVISLLLTLVADKLGRRRTLLLGSVLMTGAGVVFATTGKYYLLLLAAVVGVISPTGNEIGPFRAVEESVLAHLTDPEIRAEVFAWYVVTATLGTASGLMVCGWIVEKLRLQSGWTDVDAYRVIFWIYAGLGLIEAILTLMLSRKCETYQAPKPQEANGEARPLLQEESSLGDGSAAETHGAKTRRKRTFTKISNKSGWILLRLCLLFSIDSLASGMVPYSLINFYMDRKFHMPKSKLGSIMSATWFASSISNILASSLAKRIGLVKTMVFTHLPSAVFLGLLPLPSSLALTICLLVARASLNSMDQAPRSAFISAAVLPEERTAVMGIVNVVKTLSQSGGPVITGVLAGSSRFWIAFVVAGSLKASYDVGLLVMFVNTKLHEQGKRTEDLDDGTTVVSSDCQDNDEQDRASTEEDMLVNGARKPSGTRNNQEADAR